MSVEKIVKMKIGWRRAAEGVMLVVMAGSGAFLFALMSAKEPDEDLVTVVGLTGCVAGAVCVISEIVTLVKEQKRRRSQSQLTQHASVSTQELVDGCSWWFVVASFLVTTSFPILCIKYVITRKEWTLKVGSLTVPLDLSCGVISIFMRPKDKKGAGLKFLHIQVVIFAFGGLGALVLGFFQDGEISFALIASIALLSICLVYIIALKLREKAAQLPQAELSNFLCNTVLVGGAGAMVPMVFFTFETLSCVMSNGLESDMCENTTTSAKWLSIYLTIITAISIVSKAVSSEERGKGLTYENLAILRLKWRQKVQGALGLVTALASMYLFSVLGVQGEPNGLIRILGGVGFVALVITASIEASELVFGISEGRGQPAGVSESHSRSFSLGGIEGEMTVAGMV